MAAVVIGEALRARARRSIPREIDDVILGCAMPEAEQGLNVARIARSARRRSGLGVGGDRQSLLLVGPRRRSPLPPSGSWPGSPTAIVAGGTESMSLVPMGGHKIAPNPRSSTATRTSISRPGWSPRTTRATSDLARGAGRVRAAQPPARDRRDRRRALRRRDRRVSDAAGAARRRDEGPRRDTSIEALGKLRPAFHVKGTVTAGNSSQTSDGAAAVVVMEETARTRWASRRWRASSRYATAGVAPERSASARCRRSARR